MVLSSGKTTSGGAGPESKQMMTTVLTESLAEGNLGSCWGTAEGHLVQTNKKVGRGSEKVI